MAGAAGAWTGFYLEDKAWALAIHAKDANGRPSLTMCCEKGQRLAEAEMRNSQRNLSVFWVDHSFLRSAPPWPTRVAPSIIYWPPTQTPPPCPFISATTTRMKKRSLRCWRTGDGRWWLMPDIAPLWLIVIWIHLLPRGDGSRSFLLAEALSQEKGRRLIELRPISHTSMQRRSVPVATSLYTDGRYWQHPQVHLQP